MNGKMRKWPYYPCWREMMADSRAHALDLPLMSSIDTRYIHHYILDLSCDFNGKVFTGCIILFSKIVKKTKLGQDIESQGDKSKDLINSNIGIFKNDEYDNEALTDHSYSDCKYQCIQCDKNDAYIDQGKIDGPKYERITVELSNENNVTHTKIIENTYAVTENRSVACTSTVGCIKGANDITAKGDDCPSEGVGELNTSNTGDTSKENKKNCRSDVYRSSNSCNTLGNDTEISTKVECTQSEKGTIIIHGDKESSTDYVLVLDCWDIAVEKVEELRTSQLDCVESLKVLDKSELSEIINQSYTELLQFKCEKKSIRIWKEGVACSDDFPETIRIFYRTRPDSHSLKWTQDQDGNLCVYTHGHWINNRSLFPSQDIPQAMASWRAYIHAPRHMSVLMTSDCKADIWEKSPDYLTHYFYSKMEMPSSTLALAIGQWQEVGNEDLLDGDRYIKQDRNQPEEAIPFRIFAPKCLAKIAADILCPYVPNSLSAAIKLLGQYPFYRLDILIVPSSFNSLGMASPSLMFLSQSVLSSDGGMLIRVSHEISHSWFGLLIGPKDWTEEWLSEGFCTYTEGIIHSNALKLTATETKEIRELQDYLKYKNLQTELSITDVDLQTLRPNQQSSEASQGGISYVKNGMNPDKGFMQLHYLKGYFLLCFLESVVGLDNFCVYFKKIVEQFHHQLIDSKDVLTFFMQTFPEECSKHRISLEYLNEEWLDNPTLPKFLQLYIGRVQGNSLFQVVSENLLQITKLNTSYSGLHWRKRRKLDISRSFDLKKMNMVQTLLLLDGLICERKLQGDILIGLNECLKLSTANPDIQHKWCELVVKFCVHQRYRDVKQFLIDHQAMGVYLFGELILSKDKEQRKIAESAFHSIKHDLEDGVYKMVCLMIYGTEDVR